MRFVTAFYPDARSPMVTIRMPNEVIVGNRVEVKENLRSKIDPQLPFLMLDFEDTEYLDGCGLGVLHLISMDLEKLGGALLVRGLNRDIARLLRQTKMDTCLFIQRWPRPGTGVPENDPDDEEVEEKEPRAGSDFLRLEK
ncbi:MAG TPA: STAS domain-containing protein [Longimicrobiaceae bacterium]|nr:STAS domain-containing protein [Longimicrobiaceae bacterium]